MRSNFSRLVKRIRDTRVEEIDCSACLDRISEYITVELAAGELKAAGRMPLVKQHLDQCSVCSEEYHILRDLSRLEQEDRLPSNEDLCDRLRGSQGQAF